MKTFTQLLSVQLMTALLVACGGEAGTQPSQGNVQQTVTESTLANYQVSGHIVVKRNTRHDSDVNDSNTSVGTTSNDSFSLAQKIETSSVVGGYVNIAGSGEEGRSFSAGDEVDIYSVDLIEDQEVTLLFDIELGANDLDLFLYRAQDLNNPVAVSTGTTANESLRIDADGSYFIKVKAHRGSSSYRLALTGEIGASSFEEVGLDFIPGELIVKYRSKSLKAMGVDEAETVAKRVTLDELLTEDPTLLEGEGNMSVRSLMAGDSADLKQQTLSVIRQLEMRADVEYAEPNYLYYVSAIPSDPRYQYQTHYPVMNLPQAWDEETGSPDVIVAVVDTGVALNHPDLINKLVPGYDFVSDVSTSGDGNGIDNNPDDPGDPTSSIAFHGTHVAGTIAAEANNGSGGAGVAWGVRLMPLRALTYQSGSSIDVAQAILFAAGLPNNSGTLPAQKADIINLSLGGTSNSTTIARAIDDAREAGLMVVAAAGNAHTSSPNYPAANEGVISVSSVTNEGELAYYSNFGSTIDVAAPGGVSGDHEGDGRSDSIYSTLKDSNGNYTYGYMNGTSMATPHVAGVLALMKSVNPNLTPEDVDVLISAGSLTNDIGQAGKDNSFGYGLVNAQKSVLAALSSVSDRVAVSVSQIHFGLLTSSATITISAGSPEVAAGLVVESLQPSWLSVTPVSVDGAGLGSYLVEVSRGVLSEGAYTGNINIRTDNGDNLTVESFVSVSNIDIAADAGTEYVFLRNSITKALVGPVEAVLEQGVYSFEFPKVPEGSYYLIAGSDEDNDMFVCGTGEACGAYPSAASPMSIDIDHDETGLGFVTEYAEVSTGLQALSLTSLSRVASQ